MEPNELIVCRDASLGYEGQSVLAHLDLTIRAGDYLCIVGDNGSGKSTLLHMLGGLDRPTGGSVLVDGKDIFSLKDEELTIFRRRKIGFVFQAYNLVPVLSAYENIILPIQLDGGRVDKDYVGRVIEALGLEQRLNSLPSQLSGGQQQRASIARALAGDPAVILADEPTGALDSHTSREVLGMLQDLHRQGNTVVLITHDNSIAVQAQRIIRLEDGHVVYDGDARAPEAVVTPGLRGGVSS